MIAASKAHPVVGLALESVYLEEALTAARRAIPLERDAAQRDRLTNAVAVIAEVEHGARKDYALMAAGLIGAEA
jgi:hypothetical protein